MIRTDDGHFNQGMRYRLREIGALRGGYVLAEAKRLGHGAFRALQASDVGSGGLVHWKGLRLVDPEREPERYAIREGDVLIALRASRTPVFVAREVVDRAIAVGSWAVLTPDPLLADADFLSWYLNHPVTVQRLTRLTQGSNIQFLSLRTLRQFEIDLPSINLQRRVNRVNELHARMRQLDAQLTEARKRLVDSITMSALQRRSDTKITD